MPSRWGRIAAPLRTIFGRALDVALPTLCPSCREPVDGNGLCAKCWSRLTPIAPPYCERLGVPFAYDPAEETPQKKRSQKKKVDASAEAVSAEKPPEI